MNEPIYTLFYKNTQMLLEDIILSIFLRFIHPLLPNLPSTTPCKPWILPFRLTITIGHWGSTKLELITGPEYNILQQHMYSRVSNNRGWWWWWWWWGGGGGGGGGWKKRNNFLLIRISIIYFPVRNVKIRQTYKEEKSKIWTFEYIQGWNIQNNFRPLIFQDNIFRPLTFSSEKFQNTPPPPPQIKVTLTGTQNK